MTAYPTKVALKGLDDSAQLIITATLNDGKLVAKSCLQLKSAGKKYCTRTTSDVKKSVPDTAPAT